MSKPVSRSKRARVMEKTGGCCAYCGDHLTEEACAVDHVIPRARGGSNVIDNLLPACKPCNSSKGTKSLEEFRLFMGAKAVTGVTIFSNDQLEYLRAAGAFVLLGFNDNHQFYFETLQSKEAA